MLHTNSRITFQMHEKCVAVVYVFLIRRVMLTARSFWHPSNVGSVGAGGVIDRPAQPVLSRKRRLFFLRRGGGMWWCVLTAWRDGLLLVRRAGGGMYGDMGRW